MAKTRGECSYLCIGNCIESRYGAWCKAKKAPSAGVEDRSVDCTKPEVRYLTYALYE